MKVKFIYKFKSGDTAVSDPFDVYKDLPPNWLSDVINKKLDSAIFASNDQYSVSYSQMTSVEVVFIE